MMCKDLLGERFTLFDKKCTSVFHIAGEFRSYG